jgi:hypothetical protein
MESFFLCAVAVNSFFVHNTTIFFWCQEKLQKLEMMGRKEIGS